jgi:hypothetical protein
MFMIRSYHAADSEATTHWAAGLNGMSPYDIPMNFMKAIMEAEEVSILLNVPHVYGFFIGRSFPIEGGAPYIAAALKNCTSA